MADAARLTAAVIAQKDLAAKGKAEKQATTKALTVTALASAKAKAGKVVSRGPLEAGVDLTHVSDSESEVDTGLPPSTAPP